MDINLIKQLAGLLICILLIIRTEPALNRMGAASPLLVRLAYALIFIAAAAGVLSIMTGSVPGIETLLLATGTVALLRVNRHSRHQNPIEKGPSHA